MSSFQIIRFLLVRRGLECVDSSLGRWIMFKASTPGGVDNYAGEQLLHNVCPEFSRVEDWFVGY